MPSDHIHYHVARHSGDDDVYVTASIFGALDYAAEELGTLADFEWEYVAEIARRVAEDALRESEMRFRRLAESVSKAPHQSLVGGAVHVDLALRERNRQVGGIGGVSVFCETLKQSVARSVSRLSLKAGASGLVQGEPDDLA